MLVQNVAVIQKSLIHVLELMAGNDAEDVKTVVILGQR